MGARYAIRRTWRHGAGAAPAALSALNLAEYINVFRYLKQSAQRGRGPLNNKELRG